MAGKDWGALAKSGGLEKLKVGELKVRALYLVLGRAWVGMWEFGADQIDRLEDGSIA